MPLLSWHSYWRDSVPMEVRMYMFLAENGSPSLTECQYWMVYSALNRGDEKCAEQYLRDWFKSYVHRRQGWVTKFVPGEHYHALGEKFDDLDDAKRHLERNGYKCLGVSETHVYPNQGD